MVVMVTKVVVVVVIVVVVMVVGIVKMPTISTEYFRINLWSCNPNRY
jgi:hypothetical protein